MQQGARPHAKYAFAPGGQEMAKYQLREPAVFSSVHLHRDSASVVPHHDRIVVRVDVDFHGVHALKARKGGRQRRGHSDQHQVEKRDNMYGAGERGDSALLLFYRVTLLVVRGIHENFVKDLVETCPGGNINANFRPSLREQCKCPVGKQTVWRSQQHSGGAGHVPGT